MTISIKSDFTFEEEIKKSRFICHLKRVTTEEEARDFIVAIKKEHWKANHNCSAYTLGDRQEIQRSSDDGEPSGTAGVPMLEILKKKEITNVVAVVTRYFGGIKLGAGGLIRAYAGAVNHATDAVGLIKIVQQTAVLMTLDYSLFDSLQRELERAGIALHDSQFTDKVQATVYLDDQGLPDFEAQILETFHGKIVIEKGQKQLVEVDI